MTIAGDTPPVLVARVVPNVTGLDKQFDYLVPTAMHDRIAVGSLVRVPLHGRKVGGWVVALGVADASRPSLTDESLQDSARIARETLHTLEGLEGLEGLDDAWLPVERLLPIAKWSSVGPSAEVLELAEWAGQRWAAARLRPFLVAADPPTMVAALPRIRRTVPTAAAVGGAARTTSGVRVITPLTDPLPMVVELARQGPALVLHPAPAAARAIANRLRKAGLTVALMPDDWAGAAGGVDVVVGSRAAVWAPCPGLRTIVVLDEHDDALQEERTPTWHARDVAVERAARAGAACVLVSPCPTATALRWAGDRVTQPSLSDRVAGWPFLEIVDRTEEEPWKRSLLTSELIAHLRDPGKRVVCVINTTGRARLLACRSCRALQRCAHCDAAVVQGDDGLLTCRRCGTTRPMVCQQCGGSAMALMKPGVSRLREELEAAANRPVVAVTGATAATGDLPLADVYVGTEAVLHRVRGIDVVAFLDIDAELLAPRYRAAEHTLALIVRAGRLVGPRSGGGRVLVQTFVPRHEVLQAVRFAEFDELHERELARRRLLGLPPFRALAVIEGTGAAEMAAATGLESAPTATGAMLRADTWGELGAALLAAPRPKGSRLRVEVDPPRA